MASVDQIIVEGQGSAHPKLFVMKKYTAERNIAELTLAIKGGKTSLEHAIAKTKPGGTLRRMFGASKDPAMAKHCDELHTFLVEWKQLLRPPGYASPTNAVIPKGSGITASGKQVDNFQPKLPLLEPAKTGASSCKGCFSKIGAGELRVGLEVYA
jgi:hypothetical protein